MKSVNIYDYIVIAGYFIFMVLIGVYFKNVSKSGKDYFAGGNMTPWWVSGMSLYMSNFSAWIFTGAAGFAYTAGLFPLLYFTVGGFGYWAGTLMTGALWRRTRSISPIEYTRTRFNLSTQQFIGIVVAVNFILSGGVQLAATSKLLAPVIQIDITVVAVVTGIVILLYSFMGGLWAVMVTDTLQGIILISIAAIVVVSSLFLVGGWENVMAAVPAFSFKNTYNGVLYDEHWLIAIVLITTVGFASGGAQRFYAVKDERDARRVGFFAASLAITGPLMFGVPPLVARTIWPDLSLVDFFKPYLGSTPQDLVYIALCMKMLPNGLIGVFIAAMFAATMSALSSVYNMVSSILTRDVYQGWIRPDTPDDQLMRIGKIVTVILGLITIGLAVLFVTSTFGIFNLMQAFFTLFNIPVAVPLAFGLIFRRVPKWSAFAGIAWGLVVGVTTRYLMGWTIGPQVYLAFVMTIGVFGTSMWTATLYRKSKPALILLSVGISAALTALYLTTASHELSGFETVLTVISAVCTGMSLIGFARLFTLQSDKDTATIAEFFRKLDTPVDVANEVFGGGKKPQVHLYPLMGGTLIVMALLSALIYLSPTTVQEDRILGGVVSIQLAVGLLIWYFGRRNERKIKAMLKEASEARTG